MINLKFKDGNINFMNDWKTMESAPKDGTPINCIWGFDFENNPIITVMSYRRRFDDRVGWFELNGELKKTPKWWAPIPEFNQESVQKC